MEIPPQLLLQAIGSIYNGTISGTTNYPLYFSSNGKNSDYYAYRLRDVLPTRLLARFYYVKKDLIAMDLLWLVDSISSNSSGQAVFKLDKKNSHFDISGSPLSYILNLQEDAMINSCYTDFHKLDKFLDVIIVSSIKQFPKRYSALHVNFSRINSQFYAFSRCYIKTKKLSSQSYRNDVVNAIIALIDIIHKSLELLINNPIMEQAAAEDTSFCVRCGTKIPASSYYCPFCGAKQ